MKNRILLALAGLSAVAVVGVTLAAGMGGGMLAQLSSI